MTSQHLLAALRRRPDGATTARRRWRSPAARAAAVWDADGSEYLDLIAGIAVSALGHAHPALVEAVTDAGRQARPHQQPVRARARRRCSPSGCSACSTPTARVFFCNSGAEANEAALKLVRRHAGPGPRRYIVAAERSFHGRTMGALALTGKASIREPFGPFGSTSASSPYGDADALRDAVDRPSRRGLPRADPGRGRRDPAAGRLPRAPPARSATAPAPLLVLDEIQTGIGRTGAWFAHQAEGVRPDVITLAKGLGGGLPIGACIGFGAAGAALVAGRPRHHVRRQPGRLRRRARRARHDRARRPARARQGGRRAARRAASRPSTTRCSRRPRQRPVARRRAHRARRRAVEAAARGARASWSTPSSRTRSGSRRR